MSAPATKKQKPNEGPSDEEVMKQCESLKQVQDKLDKVNEEMDTKILELSEHYSQKKKPLFAKRNEAIKAIPNFWFTAFSNHQELALLLSDEDEQLFTHLTNLNFEEEKSGLKLKLTMTFSPNEFFNETTLWKEVITSDGSPEPDQISQSGVTWKKGQDPTSKGEEAHSFVQMFQQQNEDDVDVMVAIKEDVWPNPLTAYGGDEDEEAEEEEVEEE
eukprot:TRINITY_DN67631_c0_g1_i1.p1 TRINITY_DN67631_c0_g1~~TRINITY_DN67631_c0_g1_i1.p1  ORF type:complete len:232 (-),score=51.36 TRINITY_DN67631_c0_g1_i1:155-802(-)